MNTFDEKATFIIDAIVDAVSDHRKSDRAEVLRFLEVLHDMSERMVETIDLTDEEFFNGFVKEQTNA